MVRCMWPEQIANAPIQPLYDVKCVNIHTYSAEDRMHIHEGGPHCFIRKY